MGTTPHFPFGRVGTRFQTMRLFPGYRNRFPTAVARNCWPQDAALGSGRDFPRRVIRREAQHDGFYLFHPWRCETP